MKIDPLVKASYLRDPNDERNSDASLSGVSTVTTGPSIKLILVKHTVWGSFAFKGSATPGTYADLATERAACWFVHLDGADSWERATAIYYLSASALREKSEALALTPGEIWPSAIRAAFRRGDALGYIPAGDASISSDPEAGGWNTRELVDEFKALAAAAGLSDKFRFDFD